LYIAPHTIHVPLERESCNYFLPQLLYAMITTTSDYLRPTLVYCTSVHHVGPQDVHDGLSKGCARPLIMCGPPIRAPFLRRTVSACAGPSSEAPAIPAAQRRAHPRRLVEPVVACFPFLLGLQQLHVKGAEKLGYQLVRLAQ
jgi:hypothetical protein